MSLQTVPATMMDPASSLASSSVSTAALASGAVTSAKMATGAAAGNLAAGDVTTTMLAASAVTPAKMSQPLTQVTSQASTSGTSIDFTSIPSWVKRITVMFSGVSTSGTSNLILRVGSGSVATTGYSSGVFTANVNDTTSTAGFLLTAANVVAGCSFHGIATLVNLTGNVWVSAHTLGDTGAQLDNSMGGGSTTLSGVLDRVRITTVGGTDTFDAGSINIMYE